MRSGSPSALGVLPARAPGGRPRAARTGRAGRSARSPRPAGRTPTAAPGRARDAPSARAPRRRRSRPVSSATIGWYSTIISLALDRLRELLLEAVAAQRSRRAICGSKSSKRALALRLAWYIATSALRISSSASRAALAAVGDADAEVHGDQLVAGLDRQLERLAGSASRDARGRRSAGPRRPGSSRRTRRRRGGRRCPRAARSAAAASATATSSASPTRVAERVVDGLEVVEVDEQDRDARRAPLAAPRARAR